MFCKSCGNEIPNDVEKCPICSAALNQDEGQDDSGFVESEHTIVDDENNNELMDSYETEEVEDLSDVGEENTFPEEPEIQEEVFDDDPTGPSDDTASGDKSDESEVLNRINSILQSERKDERPVEDPSEENGIDEILGELEVETPYETKDTFEEKTVSNRGNYKEKNAAILNSSAYKSFKSIAGKLSPKTIIALLEWDFLIVVLIIIMSTLGGKSISVLIGIILIIVIDLLLLRRDQIGSEGNYLSRSKMIIVSVVAIVCVAMCAYFVSPANTAVRALKSGDSQEAKTIIQDIQGNETQEKLLDKRLNGIYSNSVKDYSKGSINDEEIKITMQSLIDVTGEDSEIGKKAKAFITSIDAYNKGKEYYDSKNYLDAIPMLAKVSEDYPKYEDAQKMIGTSKEAYKKELFSSIGATNTIEACEKSIAAINEGLKVLPDDSDLVLKKKEITTSYVALLEKDVKKAIESYDYEKADSAISKAAGLIGNDESLAELRHLVSENKPVSLLSFPIINEENTDEVDETIKDNYGNEYTGSDAYLIDLDRYVFKEGRVTYSLAEDYRRLKGVLAVEEDAYSDFDADVTIEDENGKALLKKRITKDSDPVAVDVSLTGVNKLTIRATENEGAGDIIIGKFEVFK